MAMGLELELIWQVQSELSNITTWSRITSISLSVLILAVLEGSRFNTAQEGSILHRQFYYRSIVNNHFYYRSSGASLYLVVGAIIWLQVHLDSFVGLRWNDVLCGIAQAIDIYGSNLDVLGYNLWSFGLLKWLPDSKTGFPVSWRLLLDGGAFETRWVCICYT